MENILDRLELKEDQLYMCIDYEKRNPIQDVTEFINEYSIENVDYQDIQNSIKNKEKYILITKHTYEYDETIQEKNRDENLELLISNDRTLAEVIFYPPDENGKHLKKLDILFKLLKLKIKFGLNLDSIDEFLETRDYSKKYEVAKGTLAEESKDGFIGYFINTKEKKIKPKIAEDGTIDYKNLNLIDSIKKGTILAVKIEEVRGKNGKDIFGNIILSDEPKPPPNLPKGKNTEISSDGKRLIASINGCLMYKDGIINILPVLEIKSNVDNSTGNIDFVGSVIIRGNVLSGFTISAQGDIQIHGWVEGATIISEGDISISKGVQGSGKAKIISLGNINSNFVENATLVSEKSINASYIMHCNIFCNGNLTVLGKRGLILGGKSIIGKDLIAKDIGSPMSNNTEVTVGINYKVLKKYEELVKSLDIITERYNSLEKIVEKLSKTDIEYLSNEKRALLEKTVKEKLELKKKIAINKKSIQKIIPLFTERLAKIQVTNKIYGGTKIVANNAIIFLKEDISNCVIKNVDGTIKVFKL